MIHYKARELKAGGWYYTAGHKNGEPFPLGYCKNHQPHETAEEARECYKQFLLNERLKLEAGRDDNQQHRCKICKNWTQAYASVGPYTLWFLCDEHRTKEDVSSLLSVGESWES